MNKQPLRLYLTFPVTCDDEYCDSRPHIAQIAATAGDIAGLLADIGQVRRLKRGNWKQLCNVDVFDTWAQWAESLDHVQIAWPVCDLLRRADLRNPAEIQDIVILTAQPLPMSGSDADSCRTECEHRTIYADRVCWSAYLKHTGVKVTTEGIGRDDLRRVARVFGRLGGGTPGVPLARPGSRRSHGA